MKKICVFTGTRAEYGLLSQLMIGIKSSKKLELQIVATGTHLISEFGMTYLEIEKDGFKIDKKVEMILNSDTPVGISKSIGIGVGSFAETLSELQPDAVLLLGDRFEIFAAAIASMVANIPLIHLHGGERTEGAFDEAIRHSISKMSHLHFVANNEYKNRVVQLGEEPSRVFLVGGLGVDNIMRTKLFGKIELTRKLGIKFAKRNLLITFHPVTLEPDASTNQMKILLYCLSSLKETNFIFTMPNADTGSKQLYGLVNDFVNENRERSWLFKSLGQKVYFSCIEHMDGVVGNSSSGLTEVPSFKKGTINIGDRQAGRLKSSSVIDSDVTEMSINKAFKQLFSRDFKKGLSFSINPYGTGGASSKIVKQLEECSFKNILKKKFWDL